jgi:DDE domain
MSALNASREPMRAAVMAPDSFTRSAISDGRKRRCFNADSFLSDLRKRRPKPRTIWHLEVYLKIDGRLVYLWRAVDAEGEVLDVLVQTRRNKRSV